MESDLVYYSCEFDAFVPFLIDFIHQYMTKIGASNYAGFCQDNHICDRICKN